MKKRLIALALCLVMLATCLGAGMLAPTPVTLVDENGAAATSAAVPQLGRKTLKASYADATETTGYQWQFSNDGDTWIDIYGETAQTCSLSYAKVKNMLDADGKAQLRCVVTDGEDERVSSAATVTVDYSAQTAEAATEAQSGVPLKAAPARAASYARSAAPLSDDATCSVIINYVFADGTQAANPWTANIAKGSSINQSVTSPTVLGYEPDQAKVEVNVTDIQNDKTYTVTYKPAEVEFTVKHYQQNVSNDYYTLSETVTTKGYTESAVGENLAKNYEGFYSLLYDTSTKIAADGSTVVEIYYDRYYYLMNFDLDGGYGVEPIYARYGTPIGTVGTPTKAGYTFVGWSLDGTTVVTLPKTMPAKNSTYKAVWTPDDTAKVTVVFWGENADDEEYSYIKSQQIDVKPGTEFTYKEDGSLICALEVHEHGRDCFNCSHYGSHSLTLSCYGLENAQPVDPNNYGDKDARTHFEDNCDNTNWFGNYTCKGLKKYLKDGSVCQYKDGNGSWPSYDYEYYYFLYLNGQYYKITQEQYNSWKTTTGKSVDHNKDTYYVYEGKTDICTHGHTDTCYGCGKTEHTHTSDCYMSGAGLDSNLWTFVRSDTVTVAADGSSVVNVYYDRVEKTLTFKYDYRNRKYQRTETITAKWGSNISEQYKKIAANARSTFWSAKESGGDPYTNYFGIMPQTSATYYNRGTIGDEGTMTYWGQDLNGKYTVKLFEVTGVGGYSVTDEDRYKFQGYTYHHGTDNGSDCEGAAFYYTRNSYTLTFNDGYNDVKSENVLYEAPLSTYSSYVPAAPSAYESGSVTFGGWYLNPECTGAEYKLSEHTMPADNVLLYAKWVPVTHTVEFYLDNAALKAGTKLNTHPDITVSHGSMADPTPAKPTNGSYTFIGWFYMENNVEKAFDFANMPVNKDMQVYGKWSSNVLKEYTIKYAVENGDGTLTYIADETKGKALAFTTKTFDAKTGTQLNEGYQSGYFPTTNSHSMTMDIDGNNEYTFVYVQKEKVPYTVRYLEQGTGKQLELPKNAETSDAIITETFVAIKGYAPDAYQKRLVLSANDEENVITFWYTKDDVHAPVQKVHWIQNIAGDGYTEYQSSTDLNGVIGDPYSETPLTIAGFVYNSDKSNASGELTEAGLVLNLYYDRVEYPYEFRFLEQGTDKELESSVTGTARYQAQVTQAAKPILGYTLVSAANQAINIAIEDPADTANKNVRVFYYTENEVTINYVAVGPDGVTDFGSVSPTSETVKVLTGTAQGSTATASSNTYHFVGWYDNEACTGTALSTDAKYVPQKGSNGIYAAATYYAKFEYNLTDLTITKTINRNESRLYGSQDFVFNVKSKNGSVDIDVVVNVPAGQTTGSVTIKGLTVGETYTITENTGWSWRYKLVSAVKADGATGTVVYSEGSSSATYTPNGINNEIVFTNNWVQAKWLSFTDSVKNIFGKPNT